jgi:hypothetical protein
MLHDLAYPHIQTPRLLLNQDPAIVHFFREELKRHDPSLYKWKWVDGIQLEIGEGKKEEFFDKTWWWINKKYKIGTGRIVQNCERSFCINFVELGGGYRLHCTGYNPATNTRDHKHCFLLEWLYKKGNYEGPVRHDGAKRLRHFLGYLSGAPDNPYNVALFHPVGIDLQKRYSVHLQATGYQKTGHTTKQLAKLYKYWIHARPTAQKTKDGFDTFYLAHYYQPTSPRYNIKQFPYKDLLRQGSCQYFE